MLVSSVLLTFIISYPVAEWYIDCPNALTDTKGNEDCTFTKVVLWETVAVLSLYSGDGISFTEMACNCEEGSYDERDYRNIVPISFAMLVATIIKTNSVLSNIEKNTMKKFKQNSLK
jgi:hypothetical protein